MEPVACASLVLLREVMTLQCNETEDDLIHLGTTRCGVCPKLLARRFGSEMLLQQIRYQNATMNMFYPQQTVPKSLRIS